jgi:hypothetical protein
MFVGSVKAISMSSSKEFSLENDSVGIKPVKFQAMDLVQVDSWISEFQKSTEMWYFVRGFMFMHFFFFLIFFNFVDCCL